MVKAFHENLSGLRKGKGLSQKKVAADLGLSQALLSHYENGVREPGLGFVCRACTYYNVSADMILGREFTEEKTEKKALLEEIYHSLEKQRKDLEQTREMITLWEEKNSDR